MNSKQMQSAVRQFRKADLSAIKDHKLRTKAQQLQAKQGGFTLLELLVVVTLIAVLATGALAAYEGIGESAQATAASNNTLVADSAIRNYRAVTQNYPDQWDSLVTSTGGAPDFLGEATSAAFANMPLAVSAGGDFREVLDTALASVGITTFQLPPAAAVAGVEPNLQHNEGATAGAAAETLVTAVTNFAVLPTWGAAGGCDVNSSGGALITTAIDGTTALTAAAGNRQNAINDALESDECNLVIAVGFGHDAAHSTSNSSVAISTAPTFNSKDINPANSYARYIALFHVGQDGDGNDNIVAGELFARPRLLAVLDTEGNMIDENIAAQNPTN